MRHLSYYCGDHIAPHDLKYMGHLAALEAKIEAAQLLTQELNDADFMERDNYRIARIAKAMRDWHEEIKQMEEK